MILIPLTKGQITKISDQDLELVASKKWYATKTGNSYYALAREVDESGVAHWVYLHRLILGLDASTLCDHKNGDTLDNRRENLRSCDKQGNSANRGLQSNNTSGYKGIRKVGNKWRLYIKVAGKQIHLGYFYTIEEAFEARKQAGVKYFGEFYRAS